MSKPSALYRAREKTADVLRLASGFLPFPEALPMRLTRWVWQTTAKIIDVPPKPRAAGPGWEKPGREKNEAAASAPATTKAVAPSPSPSPSGGIPAVEPGDLAGLLAANPAPLLLDVREPSETANGVIPGAKLIPMNSVLARITEIRETNAPYVVVYCASGMRSANISVHLRDRGVDARNLRGGINAWRAQNGAVQPPRV